MFLQQRALSCVGLLASSARNEDESCCLWLVDVTGSYRVRAHAVGLGAEVINKRLRTIDFSTLTRKDCALRLLETITEESSEIEKDEPKQNDSKQWRLPENTRVEVAVVAPCQPKMDRIRIADLLPSAK